MFPFKGSLYKLCSIKKSLATFSGFKGDKEQVYNYVQQQFHEKYNLKWLKPIGFNNAYALMMRREQSQRLGVKNISDLTPNPLSKKVRGQDLPKK
jgi:osmoprotectant transport system permease protein